MFHKNPDLDLTNEEIIARIAQKHPIELDPRIDTLNKPLIVEAACIGWQTRMWPPKEAYPSRLPPGYAEGGVRYAAVACSIEQQVAEVVEAVRLGCQAVHIHPRDPQDCIASKDIDLFKQVYGGVFNQVDAIPLQHSWSETPEGALDYITHAKEIMEAGDGGNRYCQGAVVLWPPSDSYPPDYVRSVQAGVRFMEENHIKPIHKLRSAYHVRQMHRVLIETGVLTQEPFVLVHDMGHPFGWPLDMDPWMPMDMITSITQTRQRIPNSVIGVYSGGRNWMPITMTAILAGVDIVRVGIEDTYWMYPHKDEVIQSNRECIKKIIDFCDLVGRPLATVEQARSILGITRTS